MKYVAFAVNTPMGEVQRVGVIHNSDIVDLVAVYGAKLRDVKRLYRWKEMAEEIIPSDMLELIEKAPVSTDAVADTLNYYLEMGAPKYGADGVQYSYVEAEVRLLPPICPRSMRDTSCFIRHMQEAAQLHNRPFNEAVLHLPPNYRTSATNVAGPHDPILWPSHGTTQLDYECEFAFVIGRYGADIPAEKALDHIFGVTLYNDISARDIQMDEKGLGMGPVKGKNFLNSNILGPYLVTCDELDLHHLDASVFLNGTHMGTDNSDQMYYTPEQLVEYISQNDALFPGEVIGSGTIGPGTLGQFGRFLEPGDEIRFESNALGCVLCNRVADMPQEFKKSRYPLP